MQTTVDFLDAIKARYGLKSNYALAKLMEQTDTGVARWVHRKNTFSDENCLLVADLLDLDPAYVMACIHAEREKNEEVRKTWADLARRLTATAAVFVMSSALILSAPLIAPESFTGAASAHAASFANNIHYA